MARQNAARLKFTVAKTNTIPKGSKFGLTGFRRKENGDKPLKRIVDTQVIIYIIQAELIK